MRRLLLTAALLVLVSGAAHATNELSVLGFNGEPVRLVQGAYGELFPIGTDTDPRHSVLALEWRRSDGALEQMLVPGTDGPDMEIGTAILYDRPSNLLFVVWESHHPGASALNLIRLGSTGDWSEPVEISGNLPSQRIAPQLVMTRELVTSTSESNAKGTDHQSVLHLLWTEEDGSRSRVIYSSVALQGGTFGTSIQYELGHFAAHSFQEAAEPAPDLLAAPTLTKGRNNQTLTATFADTETKSIVTIEIEVLPPQLKLIADKGRGHITIVGHREPRPRVAVETRDFILSNVAAASFHPAVLSYIAERAHQVILHTGNPGEPLDVETVADAVWREIIQAGASFEAQGLAPDVAQTEILALEAPQGGGHVLQLTRVAERPAISTPDIPTRIFVAPDGRDLLVSWLDEGAVVFQEWSHGVWSTIQSLQLGDALSLADAYDLLERRVQ